MSGGVRRGLIDVDPRVLRQPVLIEGSRAIQLSVADYDAVGIEHLALEIVHSAATTGGSPGNALSKKMVRAGGASRGDQVARSLGPDPVVASRVVTELVEAVREIRDLVQDGLRLEGGDRLCERREVEHIAHDRLGSEARQLLGLVRRAGHSRDGMAFRDQHGHQADPDHPGGTGKEDAHPVVSLPARAPNLTGPGRHDSETNAPPKGRNAISVSAERPRGVLSPLAFPPDLSAPLCR
jgi:hypothetical protein